jgi:hypothetical protein
MMFFLKKVLRSIMLAGLFLPQLANADIALQAAISGSWIIQGDGQGALINVAEVGGTSVFVVSWYAYLNGQQVWLLGSQPVPSNSTLITVPVQISNGTGFGANFVSGNVNRTNWGSLTFNFSSCNTGTMQYNSNLSEYGSGVLTLTRLTNTQGLVCQEQNVNTVPPPLGLTASDFCVDDYPQAACTILGDTPGSTSQFVFGSSCSSSFPQQVDLADFSPDIQNTCSSGGFDNCGTCGFSLSNTAKLRNNIKNIDIDLISNRVYEGLLKLQNN